MFAAQNSDGESNDDKENDCEEDDDIDDPPAYLKYEDFSHTPMGLETYNDGLRHPIEMRRILTGDLSNEMTVSYKENPEDSFRDLSYPKTIKRTSNIDTHESPNLLPKPPKLLKASSHSFPTSSLFTEQEAATEDLLTQSNFLVSPRKPGRPPTASGSFDPETGSVRYSCRLHCGASLASAKGRRKHEKKHCPNFGKVAPPILRGQRPTQTQPMSIMNNPPQNNPLGFAHSLFGALAQQSIHGRDRKIYECRFCGKVLKTYEGRRLHEKLQHVAKQSQQTSSDNDIMAEDNKQLLIEHLKAAGMDPDCLEENGHTIEYGDDEEEDDEDDIEAPSSDSITIMDNTV